MCKFHKMDTDICGSEQNDMWVVNKHNFLPKSRKNVNIFYGKLWEGEKGKRVD